MNTKYRRLIESLIVATFLFFAMTVSAMGLVMWRWDPYPYGPYDPGTVDPHVGLSHWVLQPSPLSLNLEAEGEYETWLAIDNEHTGGFLKKWYIDINYGAVDLPYYNIYEIHAYYNNPGPTEIATVKRFDLNEWVVDPHHPGDFIRRYYFESSEDPDWEVVRLGYVWKGGGGGQKGTVTITANSLSYFNITDLIGPCVNIDSLNCGPPYDTAWYTAIWVFNDSIPVDINTVPEIMAPPQSGTWSYEFVYIDPHDDPRPQGGVRWYTDGLGIESGQMFNLEFCLTGITQQNYSLYLYDSFNDKFEKITIPSTQISGTVPTLTEWGIIFFCVLLFGWMAYIIIKRRKTAVLNI